LLTGIGAAAAAGVYFVATQQSAYASVYETSVGEQKHVVLADGTLVFLDTNTRLHASLDREIRLIALERGRCNIHVMETDKRPFIVDAATQRIVAGHTVFDVERDGDDICVVLLQGSATTAGGETSRVLRPGDRFTAGRAGARIDRPNLTPLLAWQTGQAIFDNETLTDAIREMNRYSTVRLEVSDPAVAGMRVSGVYRVGDNVSFARSVAQLLPVGIELGTDNVRFTLDQTRKKV
jgi:transmembrane sensor